MVLKKDSCVKGRSSYVLISVFPQGDSRKLNPSITSALVFERSKRIPGSAT
jgi:hypothetical protein